MEDDPEIPVPLRLAYLEEKNKRNERVLFGDPEHNIPGLVQNVDFIMKMHYVWPLCTLSAAAGIAGTLFALWLKAIFHL